MKKIYIFDMDGTLTPSRREMTPDFEEFFSMWANTHTFFLVSGSNLEKIKEQVPQYILDLSEGVFTCGGNQLWLNGKLSYNHEFKPSDDLLSFLKEQLENSKYPLRAGNHIEDRGSMLNFSVIGRDCSLEERINYFEYDLKTQERANIANEIINRWANIDAVIGGQISIDITPKGMNKSQVLNEVKKFYANEEYIFIGDRTMEGGNDYPLAKIMHDTENCSVYQAGEPSAEDGYKDTQKILEELSDK
ncbi:MAG TPA: HAD-IIB family hydrolase [Candidatus Marinimicrobia bacterium]|nr:HAD-IIB family hydrolase [Candidatus Neomarinimicrobiota bacterium]|tara:strand:+ start:3033 stop:3773 length:741 start_codon:yes stop_codon:yes gene_type:complete